MHINLFIKNSINLTHIIRNISTSQFRRYAEAICDDSKRGLLLGAYDSCDGDPKFSPSAKKFDEEMAGGKLQQLLKGIDLRRGRAKVFNNMHDDYYAVAVAGLGPEEAGYSELENLDQCKENIRVAAGVGARSLQKLGVNRIMVEGFTNAEAAAEGAALSVWHYKGLRQICQTTSCNLELFDSLDREGWTRGILKADSQNLARRLEEVPGNLMTPSIFAQTAIEMLCPCGVQVDVRDREWLETKRMTAFLSMARGSCEPPLLLEIGYCGGAEDDRPVVLVGKGVTFDSGGLCLKPCRGMMEYRGDMAGAAVIVAAVRAIAQMNLPINVKALIPLCENMPGGMAMKPGDVVLGMNGKTIRIENTDNDGRIILADALAYSAVFKPCLIINVASLTHGMRRALGASCSGVFSTSDLVWKEMSRAGAETGDRVWRFPLWRHFTTKVTDYTGVDVNNVGKGIGGDPCLGAAFLMEFVPDVDFCHLDITGTGLLSTGVGFPYLRKDSMTGRPTRTLIQFLYQMACPHDKSKEC